MLKTLPQYLAAEALAQFALASLIFLFFSALSEPPGERYAPIIPASRFAVFVFSAARFLGGEMNFSASKCTARVLIAPEPRSVHQRPTIPWFASC